MVLGDGGGQCGAEVTVWLAAFVPVPLMLWQPVAANAPKASRTNILFIYCLVVDVVVLAHFLSKSNAKSICHKLPA